MEQGYLFKKSYDGTIKKGDRAGQIFRTVELHNPETLENTTFFLRDGSTISLQGYKIKDKVIAVHGIEVYNGQPKLTLDGLRKV